MLDIKELKSNLDIVDVLKMRGLELTRKGQNLFAKCPFHKDSKPSFSVNPKAQLWSCFGCGIGGDVFTFVQKQEGIGFVEAVKKLCKLDIQKKDLEDLNRERQRWEAASVDRPSQAVLDRIVQFWQQSLARSGKARKYLEARRLWVPEILRALKLGYSSGKLTQMLPINGKLQRQLKQMGILNKSGNEFLYNRVVAPIFDETGVLANVYGRTLYPESDVPHLYLPGPHRGVFNPTGIQEGSSVIITESILDALSLVVLGFTHTTASYGTNGFTADLRAALLKAKTTRVYCAYDSDTVGDHAADQLAHDLASHDIEVLRVELPVNDPNEFLMSGASHEDFQKLLDRARSMPVAGASKKPSSRPAAKEGKGEEPREIKIELGDRTYRIEGEPTLSSGSLRVVLRAIREEKSFVDTVNLYSDRARASFLGRLFTLFRGQVPKQTLEEDLFAILDEIEARVEKPEDTSKKETMSDSEREEALTFLKRKDLVSAVIEDLTKLSVVGEEDNKLLAYLVATSRKLIKPLSLSVISRASAGKSWLLNRVADLMPREEILRYTRMSPRALFYDEPGRYKHKILFIEEAIGAKDADLGVRSMQSEQRLANLATMTDPKTGKLRTQETVVEGPLTYLTSSIEPLEHETATRGFEIAIDESSDQTQRIVASLLHERTLEGIRARLTTEGIIRRHRNAQRLLKALLVVNPYAPQLTFPADTLRLRREADKYLSLIDTIALLHQYQRKHQRFTHDGDAHEYICVIPADIDIANRLMASCLSRALSDLPGPAQELLVKIRAYVVTQAKERGMNPLGITFNRREIREWIGWSDYQVRVYLELLAELEYIEVATGGFGRRYVYTLSPDHRLLVQANLSIEEKIVALGLTPANRLQKRIEKHLATI